MSQDTITVVGIDVGGKKKGFHAVSLRDGKFERRASTEPAEIAKWCCEQKAKVVAVDAPSGWSQSGRSREAERDLEVSGEKISCFATPTRAIAEANETGFYDWVFNGERLYDLLADKYPLFDGSRKRLPICFETFPQGIVCALAGKKVCAKPKVRHRRRTLSEAGYDDKVLSNIDFIDAALCALTAHAFLEGQTCKFGQKGEGFIVIPTTKATTQTPE